MREERSEVHEVKGMNTKDMVSYCIAHASEPKELIKVGLGVADAAAYIKMFSNTK